MSVCIVVEGNIGAGKSTVLSHIETQGFKVFYENVDSWRPYLELFYAQPERWSFALQMAILHDMAQQKKEADKLNPEDHPYVFFERSPLSNMLFARMARMLGNMTDLELHTYELFYEELCWKPEFTVLIDTPVITCLERVQKRQRPGEAKIDLDYLQSVEAFHRTGFEDIDLKVTGTVDPVNVAGMITGGLGL